MSLPSRRDVIAWGNAIDVEVPKPVNAEWIGYVQLLTYWFPRHFKVLPTAHGQCIYIFGLSLGPKAPPRHNSQVGRFLVS